MMSMVDKMPEKSTGDCGIPKFRMRTLEETEIAKDLLQLSRFLPPRPKAIPVPMVVASCLTPPDTPGPNAHSIIPTSKFTHSAVGSLDSGFGEPLQLTPLVPSQPTHFHLQTVSLSPPPDYHGFQQPSSVIMHYSYKGHLQNHQEHATVPLTPSTSEYSSDAESFCTSEVKSMHEMVASESDYSNCSLGTGEMMTDSSSSNSNTSNSRANDGDSRYHTKSHSTRTTGRIPRKSYTYDDLLAYDGRSSKRGKTNYHRDHQATEEAPSSAGRKTRINPKSPSISVQGGIITKKARNSHMQSAHFKVIHPGKGSKQQVSNRKNTALITRPSGRRISIPSQKKKSRITKHSAKNPLQREKRNAIISNQITRRNPTRSIKRQRHVDDMDSSENELTIDEEEDDGEYQVENASDEDSSTVEFKSDDEEEEDYEFAERRVRRSNYGHSSPQSSGGGGKSKEQRYVCSECGKHYATSSNLSRHKQTHRSLDSQNAKRCSICGKAYVSMPALSMHILTHNLTHKCEICGKGFSRPWLLQGHLRSHTGEKPYGCAHCSKAFADRSNLRAHMQTHSSAKNYTCKRCNKSFALKSYLNKHYDSSCFKDTASNSSNTDFNSNNSRKRELFIDEDTLDSNGNFSDEDSERKLEFSEDDF